MKTNIKLIVSLMVFAISYFALFTVHNHTYIIASGIAMLLSVLYVIYVIYFDMWVNDEKEFKKLKEQMKK